jgi:type II secretory pathway pseudopilin PulG
MPGARASTMTEVIIAVAIVAIAGAGLMSTLGYGFALTKTLRENQRATQILLEKLETLRLYNWEQVNSNGFLSPTFTSVYDPQDSARPGISYYGKVTVGGFPGSYGYHTNMRKVTITLNWTNSQRPQSRSLITAVAKDGLQNYVW